MTSVVITQRALSRSVFGTACPRRNTPTEAQSVTPSARLRCGTGNVYLGYVVTLSVLNLLESTGETEILSPLISVSSPEINLFVSQCMSLALPVRLIQSSTVKSAEWPPFRTDGSVRSRGRVNFAAG